MKTHVIEVKNDLKEGRKNERTTVFHDILSNKNIRPQEKDTNHLATEAQTFIAAGTITTTHILSTLTFYILDNSEILQKLQSELQTVSQPTWQQLEALPYLVK